MRLRSHGTLNQRVVGSSPTAPTKNQNENNILEGKRGNQCTDLFLCPHSVRKIGWSVIDHPHVLIEPREHAQAAALGRVLINRDW